MPYFDEAYKLREGHKIYLFTLDKSQVLPTQSQQLPEFIHQGGFKIGM